MLPRALAPLSLLLMSSLPAFGQEDAANRLSIELNAIETQDDACRMSFVVLNGHEADLTNAVFEAVLFDAKGAVNRMTLFDFGALPAQRTRVRQFVVPQMPCETLGRVLINGTQTCEAEATEAGKDLCSDGLTLTSRVDVEVMG